MRELPTWHRVKGEASHFHQILDNKEFRTKS